MGAFIGIAVVFFFIVLFSSLGKAAGGSVAGPRGFERLLASGTPARGILLQVDSSALPVEGRGMSMVRVQRRGVTIDVEIPGQTPYIVQTTAILPSNLARDVLPGATVELRVDPRNQQNIAIVGPGAGFAVTRLA